MKDAETMAKSKIPVYIGREALETIILSGEIYPHLHHIFNSHADICVDLTDEEFDKIMADEECDLSQLLRNDVSIVPQHDYFETIKDDKTRIVNSPRGMFFLNISQDEAQTLTQKYGVLVQSENAIDDACLQFAFRRNLDKGEIVEGKSDGWGNMFNGLDFPPSNSLIITDNYLFENVQKNVMVGFENLKMLLNAILPKQLCIDFHLFIITPTTKNCTPARADKLYDELKTYLKNIRDYNITLEFVFCNTLHARKIISNYFVIECDKGFQLFSTDKTKVYDDNEIEATSVLHDVLNSKGDSLLKISSKDIDKIRKKTQELKEQIAAGIPDHTKKIIGDCRNRLMMY